MSETVRPHESGQIDEWMKEYFGREVPLTTPRLGFGTRPALLIIDMQESPTATLLVQRAIKNTAVLLQKAREKSVPIFFTVIGFRQDMADFLPLKLASMQGDILGTKRTEIVDELKPADELVLVKKANSAFNGTNLLGYLIKASVDTVIICGIHTSGCIRATASDSFSYGFRTVIPEECVGDSKGLNPHKANLCDLHIRGADVVRLEEVLAYMNEIGTKSVTHLMS